MSKGNLTANLEFGDLTAVLKAFQDREIGSEDLRRQILARDSDPRTRVLGRLLTIERSSYLTPPDGDSSALAARWRLVESDVMSTAHRILGESRSRDCFDAFGILVDRCADSDHEFMVWQTVAEVVYQLRLGLKQVHRPKGLEDIRSLLSAMEHYPAYKIGSENFKLMLPRHLREGFTVSPVIPDHEKPGQGSIPGVWGFDRMARLQMVIHRHLVWMK